MNALAGLAGNQPKRYRRGTDRIVPPDATLARVRPLLPAMGITRIANVTGLDRIGIPVVMVSRPNSRSLSLSQGKGLDLAAAKASGVMEAIEAYHAETITLPLKFASFGELCYSHSMIDIGGLPFCAGSRWRESHDALDRGTGSAFRGVPLAAARAREHQLHGAAAARQRLLCRQLQWSRLGQQSCRSDLPWYLRADRA